MKPHDPFLILVQIKRTHIDVVKDDQNEFFKMVRVQWWVQVKEKGQIRMNDVYTKIVGTLSGNVIWQMWNNGSRCQRFFSLFFHEKI